MAGKRVAADVPTGAALEAHVDVGTMLQPNAAPTRIHGYTECTQEKRRSSCKQSNVQWRLRRR